MVKLLVAITCTCNFGTEIFAPVHTNLICSIFMQHAFCSVLINSIYMYMYLFKFVTTGGRNVVRTCV